MASLKQLIQAGFTTRQGKALLGLGGGGLKLSVPAGSSVFASDSAYMDYEGDPWPVPAYPGGTPEWSYYPPNVDNGVFSYDATERAIKLEKDALLAFDPEDSSIDWQGATDTDEAPKQLAGGLHIKTPGSSVWAGLQGYVEFIRPNSDMIATGVQPFSPSPLRARVPTLGYRAGTLFTMRYTLSSNPSNPLLTYCGLNIAALIYDPASSAS